jgi:ribonuclease BN (tRNA processing enzyme)
VTKQPAGVYVWRMSTSVTILGSKGGPAIRTGGPSPTSLLLDAGGKVYVIDCGLGVTRGYVEAGYSLKALSTILITHHHSDHNLEFGNLVHTAWTAGLATPVNAYGPAGLAGMWPAFCRLNAFDISTRIIDEGRPDLEPMITVREFADGLVMDDGTVRVEAMRNDHPPVTDSFALRFTVTSGVDAGKVIVFSGDTAHMPEMAAFARNADMLVHEAMLLPAVDRLVARVGNGARLKAHLLASHTAAEDVARTAAEAGVKHLVLNHLIPADDPAVTDADWEQAVRTRYAGPLTLARDGLKVSV